MKLYLKNSKEQEIWSSMEFMLNKLKSSKTNSEFFESMKR